MEKFADNREKRKKNVKGKEKKVRRLQVLLFSLFPLTSYFVLHITKLVIKPCLVGIVDYILIQQNTGKLTEEIF